jgi:hypothetical protein
MPAQMDVLRRPRPTALAPTSTITTPPWVAERIEAALLGRVSPPPEVDTILGRLHPDLRSRAARLAALLIGNGGRLSACTTWVRLRPEPNAVAPMLGVMFLDEDHVANFGAFGPNPPPLEPFWADRLGADRPWDAPALTHLRRVHRWASIGDARR